MVSRSHGVTLHRLAWSRRADSRYASGRWHATSAVQVDRSPILTVRQKPFAVQSSLERSFDTQAIEIVSSWD